MALWKYYIGPGSVMGFSSDLARYEIDEALEEQMAMTAIKFQRANERQAHMQFYFSSAQRIYDLSNNTNGLVPLALHIGKQIHIVSDRDRFYPGNMDLRIIRRVVWHETGHHYFGLTNHPKYLQADYIMNSNLSVLYPHPWEAVNLWQRRHGKPAERFTPVPQSLIGRDIQKLVASIDHAKEVRAGLVNQRNNSTDVLLRISLTNRIQELTNQITVDNSTLTNLSRQWQAIKAAWRDVLMTA